MRSLSYALTYLPLLNTFFGGEVARYGFEHAHSWRGCSTYCSQDVYLSCEWPPSLVPRACTSRCADHLKYLDRKPRRQRPTAHLSYDEGLNLIRSFLRYASTHTVEEIQAFTSQWVPTPRWVKLDEVTISDQSVRRAAEALTKQLGRNGIDKVGGSTWWQWRKDGATLGAEWIEMKGDYQRRKHNRDCGKRIMLYVHGGAYFFGSVDEHRYQMQRHARKLMARVFAR